jgi:hypothetical protein
LPASIFILSLMEIAWVRMASSLRILSIGLLNEARQAGSHSHPGAIGQQ